MHLIRRAAAGLLVTSAFLTVSLASAAAETVPLPIDAASGLSDQINSTACPAAGYCAAVGFYTDSSPNTDGLLESQSGGVWSVTSAGATNLPNASAPDASLNPPVPSLNSVACAAAGNCVAVGSYTDENGLGLGLIETESNGQWAASEAPLTNLLPAADPSVQLQYVSCPAAGDCVAVGSYDDASDGQQGLIETESNGVWSASEVTALPATAESPPTVNFLGLSCSSVGNCAAVGIYDDSSLGDDDDVMIDTETAGSWTVSQLDFSNLGVSSSSVPRLDSVSCPSDGNCTAVGYYEEDSSSGSPYEGLLVNEAGGVWQPATAAQLPGDASTSPVGGAVQEDLYLNSVSCASAGNCTAVGSYDATSADDVDAMELTETNGAWAQAADTTLPSDAAADPEGSLDAVACVAGGSCVATGTYENTNGDNSIVTVRQAAGTASVAGVDQSTGWSTYVPSGEAVSCASDGYCASGGSTSDLVTGNFDAYLLDAPAAPSIPSASVSGTQATLSWTAPGDNGGLPVSDYTVTATDLTNAAGGGQTVSVDGSATSAVITGLTPGDSYMFTVSPSSPLGVGLSATSASVAVPVATTTTTTTTTTTATTTTTTPPSAPAPAPAPGETASKPSTGAISSSLGGLLTPHGATAKLTKLRRTHSYSFSYHALEAGVVSVDWYQITGHGKHTHKTLVASGKATAKGIGSVKLVVHLTAKGRRLVASSGRHLNLTADVRFAGGGSTVLRVHAFTLS